MIYLPWRALIKIISAKMLFPNEVTFAVTQTYLSRGRGHQSTKFHQSLSFLMLALSPIGPMGTNSHWLWPHFIHLCCSLSLCPRSSHFFKEQPSSGSQARPGPRSCSLALSMDPATDHACLCIRVYINMTYIGIYIICTHIDIYISLPKSVYKHRFQSNSDTEL